jgi:hypothetical protein
MNQDVKGLRLSPLTVNHVYDLSDNGISIQDDDTPLIEDDIKSIIDTFKVFIPPPPLNLKKKGRLKGSKKPYHG